eukprot:SM000023S07680  [mRNA]  locus=s23:884070:884862:- [translate_table: standard]
MALRGLLAAPWRAALSRSAAGEGGGGGVAARALATRSPAKSLARRGPKRPMSAYLYFSIEKRTAMKEEQPSLSFGELSKALGERWLKLSPEEKQPYKIRAEEDRRRYDEEVQQQRSEGA